MAPGQAQTQFRFEIYRCMQPVDLNLLLKAELTLSYRHNTLAGVALVS
jgi:hypothetical protein